MTTIKSTDTLVALDIGTSKVLCLVADIDDKGELRIIGIGNEPCSGLNKGVISEIDATVSSVRRAKEKASSMSSCNIESVTTGIAGNHIQSYNGNGAINIMNDAWICMDVFVAPGVTVGSFGVALARSVILSDISNYEVFLGNPAKCVRMRKEINSQI